MHLVKKQQLVSYVFFHFMSFSSDNALDWFSVALEGKIIYTVRINVRMHVIVMRRF